MKTSQDENWFVDCLSIGAFNKTVSVANLRERVSKYYESNKNDYKSYIQEKDEEKILHSLQKNGEYSTQEALKIASDCLQVPILLYRQRFSPSLPSECFTPKGQRAPTDAPEDIINSIKIVFKGNYTAGHYMLVVHSSKYQELIKTLSSTAVSS